MNIFRRIFNFDSVIRSFKNRAKEVLKAAVAVKMTEIFSKKDEKATKIVAGLKLFCEGLPKEISAKVEKEVLNKFSEFSGNIDKKLMDLKTNVDEEIDRAIDKL